MQGIQAVIFDMDGVLIDSEPVHFMVANQVLGAAGHALTREENEAFIGMTNAPFWAAMIDRFSLPETADSYVATYERQLLHALEQPHAPEPGVIELIEAARQRGLCIAVASSSPRSWIDATLRSIGLANAFAVIVSGDDVPPREGKPHPAIYQLAARRLKVQATACLAIEDSPNGVLSAHRAGMYVIGVRTPYTAHLSLEGADRIVDSLSQVALDD
jgi:HAD superfamily hydrolase (TIGR01509 family)